MMRLLLTLVLSCLLPAVLFAEEQRATVLQQTTLRAEPYSDAAALATLSAKQQVTVIERKGGWYQVRIPGRTGWLRMSHVRLGDGSNTTQGSSGLSETLRFLSTGRSGSSGVTVATGIRGLDAADVANARPDHRAVNRLERYRVSQSTVESFAHSGKLRTQPLGYISE